jgi:hypothetical protein
MGGNPMAVLRTTRQTVTGCSQKWWHSTQYLSSEHPLAMLYQWLIKGQRLATRPRSQDMQQVTAVVLLPQNMAAPRYLSTYIVLNL